MADLTFLLSNSGTLTAAYSGFLNGGTTLVAAPTPALTSWTSSDPTIFSVSSTGADTASFACHKAGSVTLTVAVPAASDGTNNYSAFSGTKSVEVDLNSVTITQFTITVGP